ncbi:hypothetical protein EJP77_09880 [Paenibacillus zeisoli]|uniref:DUF1453 family protein n=1 Tax=Paenibacillus zeisoli TaxID=2496267 RepID=A0A3S1B7M2_9BACL|nr:hypothetical protein [Paenibacillus zeisoli]RUT31690.1 hypothetical protein EJP77_09880 [Paenibacillus zeisoli]
MNYIWIVLLAVIVITKRQLTPRPISAGLVTFPLLLVCYGGYMVTQLSLGGGEIASLLLSLAMGAAVGMYEGRFIRVFEQDGVYMRRGSLVTLGIWLLSIPVRFIVSFGFTQLLHIHVQLTGSNAYIPFLFSLAGILLGRAVYLIVKYPGEFQRTAAANR